MKKEKDSNEADERAEVLIDTLSIKGSLTDLEKIELRNLVNNNGYTVPRHIKEYLGAKSAIKPLHIIGVIILVISITAVLLVIVVTALKTK